MGAASPETDRAKLTADAEGFIQKYMAVKSKHNRQSAANVLPILMEKGLVAGAEN